MQWFKLLEANSRATATSYSLSESLWVGEQSREQAEWIIVISACFVISFHHFISSHLIGFCDLPFLSFFRYSSTLSSPWSNSQVPMLYCNLQELLMCRHNSHNHYNLHTVSIKSTGKKKQNRGTSIQPNPTH